jgi:hypothetical protein
MDEIYEEGIEEVEEKQLHPQLYFSRHRSMVLLL